MDKKTGLSKNQVYIRAQSKSRYGKLKKKKNLHPTFSQMNKTVYQQEEKQKKVSKLMTTEHHTVNENWVKGEIQKEI